MTVSERNELTMKSSTELKKDIMAIDHRGYPGYKGLRGSYQFGDLSCPLTMYREIPLRLHPICPLS